MKQAKFYEKLRWSEEIWGKDRCWKWFPHDVFEHQQRVSVDGRKVLVHRYAYQVLRERGRELAGPLKKNQPLVQTCCGAGCVSPYHHMPALSRKALAAGGKWSGVEPNDPRGAHNRDKDKCPYGHPYSADNTLYTKDGRRRCLFCHRERGWLPLDLRFIVYPNEIVKALLRKPAKPVPPEVEAAQYERYREERSDYEGWSGLESEPEPEFEAVE